MTTIRLAARERDRFTVIDRRAVNDDSLSFRARGILVWLLDKPDGWRVDSEQIADAAKEGRDAVRTALNELATAGYITRRKYQNERGHWVTETWVHERPVPADVEPPEVPRLQLDAGAEESGVGESAADAEQTDAWESDVGGSGPIPKTVSEDCDRTLSSTSSSRSSTVVADEQFEMWWGKYPKKASGKGEARTKWRKMPVKDRRAAEAGLDKHLAWWAEHGTEVRFIPAGSVWLNQRRWEDDEPRTRTVEAPRPTSMMERVRLRRAAERAAAVALEQEKTQT